MDEIRQKIEQLLLGVKETQAALQNTELAVENLRGLLDQKIDELDNKLSKHRHEFTDESSYLRLVDTVTLKVIDDATSLSTGDGQTTFVIPVELDGKRLVRVGAHVFTVSSSGTPEVQIHNATKSLDMLSTTLTIDVSEKDSSTASVSAVIDNTKNQVNEGDEIRIDVDTAGTSTAGLEVRLSFR